MGIILDNLARRYNKLPSELLQDSWENFQINYLAYEAGIKMENESYARAKAHADAEQARQNAIKGYKYGKRF